MKYIKKSSKELISNSFNNCIFDINEFIFIEKNELLF